MANGNSLNENYKKVLLYRAHTQNIDLSETIYTPPSQAKLGVNNGTPSQTNSDLTEPIPVQDGTCLDTGEDAFTGSNGADNSTDNTATYKEGANQTDNTGQNLIANSSNATKTWTKSISTYADAAQYTGLWIYIKDATALAKFLSSGTCLEVKLGSDSSNYYSKTWEATDLSTGWNWIHSGTEVLSDWTETGTVSGNIDTFIIQITTNNATDTFTTGDVVYDLLRQWEETDFYMDQLTGWPTFNYTDMEVTNRFLFGTTKATGFNPNGYAIFNGDTTPLMMTEETTDAESKDSNDQIAYVSVLRLI